MATDEQNTPGRTNIKPPWRTCTKLKAAWSRHPTTAARTTSATHHNLATVRQKARRRRINHTGIRGRNNVKGKPTAKRPRAVSMDSTTGGTNDDSATRLPEPRNNIQLAKPQDLKPPKLEIWLKVSIWKSNSGQETGAGCAKKKKTHEYKTNLDKESEFFYCCILPWTIWSNHIN